MGRSLLLAFVMGLIGCDAARVDAILVVDLDAPSTEGASCDGAPPGAGLLCVARPAACATCTCYPCDVPHCDEWCENPCWTCVAGTWLHGDPSCGQPCAGSGP